MKKGLVLEGGALRGIYTAGVLDAFLDNNISFDGVIGESAGTIHGASFVAKQVGRSLNSTADWCGSPKYASWRSFFLTGNYFNSNFCYKKIPEMYPLDNKTFSESNTPFYVVCTDFETAEPLYHLCPSLELGTDHIRYLQASASMPVVSRPLKINGRKYVDGGIADAVPIKKFQEMGYEKNVVILTQEKKDNDEFNFFVPLTKIFCPFHKKIIKALETQVSRYNDDLKYLEAEVKAGRVFLIRPKYKPVADVLEKNPDNIRTTYKQGYDEALSIIDDVKKFLAD